MLLSLVNKEAALGPKCYGCRCEPLSTAPSDSRLSIMLAGTATECDNDWLPLSSRAKTIHTHVYVDLRFYGRQPKD